MADSTTRARLTRREALILSSTAGVGVAASTFATASDSVKTAAHQGPGNLTTPRSAIAKTQYGKVRGYLDGGVFTFKGIPYGQTTAGENRWLPAKPPTPWTDEYPALVYGANCPQNLHPWTALEQTFIQDWDDGWQSEDMLKLNIWTSSLSGKRPVMVYFHGGGFSFGSSYELPSHEGAQMARHHEVVQVSVNHRLNILGFFDAAEIGGSAYEDSANVGMTDLVAALRWVRENIANFGGDPDRVMIYGQSGGGSKVTTLLGMPSASGLIHRAAAQSGGGGNIPSREQQRELARQTMKELGLNANDIGSLQKMEWAKLIAAGNAAADQDQSAAAPDGGAGRTGHTASRLVALRRRKDREHALVLRRRARGLEKCADADRLRERRGQSDVAAAHRRGVACESLQGLWRRRRPARSSPRSRKPIHRSRRGHLSYICSGMPGLNGLSIRNNVVKMAGFKHALNAAPAYTYYFTWQTPILDGVPGAWHTAELQFCFDNTQALRTRHRQHARSTGAGEEDGFIVGSFRCDGRSSLPALKWQPTDPQSNRTMIWDNRCRMVDDPDGEARKILLPNCPCGQNGCRAGDPVRAHLRLHARTPMPSRGTSFRIAYCALDC